MAKEHYGEGKKKKQHTRNANIMHIFQKLIFHIQAR